MALEAQEESIYVATVVHGVFGFRANSAARSQRGGGPGQVTSRGPAVPAERSCAARSTQKESLQDTRAIEHVQSEMSGELAAENAAEGFEPAHCGKH